MHTTLTVAVNAPVQYTSKTHVKCCSKSQWWSLSLLQMVTLFQAQAQA
jgi:hypothetical protein